MPAILVAGILSFVLAGAVAAAGYPLQGYWQTAQNNSNSNDNKTYLAYYQGFVSVSNHTYSGLMVSVLLKNFPGGAYNTPWGTLGAMHPTATLYPATGGSRAISLTSCGQQSQGADFAIWCSSSATAYYATGGRVCYNNYFDGTFLYVSNNFRWSNCYNLP